MNDSEKLDAVESGSGIDLSDIEFMQGGNYTADDFYKFGLDYGNGRNGVAWDLHKAEKCFLQAAWMGNTQAPIQLVQVYDTWKDRENTFKWSLKVAEQGNEEMQFYVGHCLDVGYGVEEDTREALKWYVPLADKGHKDSQIKACLAFRKLGDEKMAAHYEKMAEHSIKKEKKAASIPPGAKRKFSGSYFHLVFCIFLMLVSLVPVLSKDAREDFVNRFQAYKEAGGKVDATFYVWGFYFLGAFLYPIANRSYFAEEIKQRRRERTWNSVKTAADGADRHANNYTYTETTWSDGSKTNDEASQKAIAAATAPAVFMISGAALLILPILFLPFVSIFTLISNYVFNTKPE